MAKLTGTKKAAFLERMAKGRKKAKRANPKPKAKRKAVKKNPAGKTKRTRPAGAKKKARAQRSVTAKKNGARRPISSKAKKNAQRSVRRAPKRNGRRRNSDDIGAAERKFEEFHQKPASRIIDYDQAFNYPSNFAEMGKLKELRCALDELNPDFPLTKFGACQAVCTPDGANIYFIAGDQSVSLEDLGISSDKDVIELGPCTYISYHTVKGFHDFDPIDYWHRFGEEDGIFPVLAYDRLNRNLFLLGGNYRVRPEGIVN